MQNKKVLLTSLALIELSEATNWYEQKEKGLGKRFLSYAKKTKKLIKENPEIYPIFHKNTRKAKVSKFPYILLYYINKKNIKILSVFHCRRDPKRLIKKLK